MLIYQIVHIESGHKYVGQTTRPAIKRWREHLYSLRHDRHPNRYLQAAWNKYGESSFRFEAIKECESLEELNSSEIELIQKGSDLYNLADGGNAFTHDIKAKKSIGESNKIPIVGMNIKTSEIKEYTSAADAKLDGFDPTRIRKCVLRFVSKRKDGTTFESISHKGWVWTSKEDFSMKKIQALRNLALRSKIRVERPVIGMNIFTKDIVKFISSAEGGRRGFTVLGVNRACAADAIHRGFVWSYADIDDPQSLLSQKLLRVTSKVRTGPRSW
jgi:hypothetical protein